MRRFLDELFVYVAFVAAIQTIVFLYFHLLSGETLHLEVAKYAAVLAFGMFAVKFWRSSRPENTPCD